MLTDGRHPRQTELVKVVLKEQWSLTVVSYKEKGVRDEVKRVQPAVIVVAPRGGDSAWIAPLIQLVRPADISVLVHPVDDDSSYPAGAALVGASGYLRRGTTPELVMAAIQAQARGELVWLAADLAQAAESLLAWQRCGLIPRAPASPQDSEGNGPQAASAVRCIRLARAMIRYAETKDELRRAVDAAICLGLPLFEVERALDDREQVRTPRLSCCSKWCDAFRRRVTARVASSGSGDY
jgi:DNA-binding NarL/FixJ family response regulator